MRSSHLRTFERSSVAVRRSTAARYRHCCRRYYAFYSGYGNLLLFYIQICHDGCSHCWITCCADVAYIAPCTYSIQSVQSIAKMTNDKMMMSFWYDKCTWGASWVYYTGLWFVGVFEMGGEWDWFLCLFFLLLLGMEDSSWFLNSISVEWHRMHLFSYPIITPCAYHLLSAFLHAHRWNIRPCTHFRQWSSALAGNSNEYTNRLKHPKPQKQSLDSPWFASFFFFLYPWNRVYMFSWRAGDNLNITINIWLVGLVVVQKHRFNTQCGRTVRTTFFFIVIAECSWIFKKPTQRL